MADNRTMQTDAGGDPGDPPVEGAMQSVERIERIGESVILYDASLVNQIDAAWFEAAHWPQARAAGGDAGGRGPTLFVRCAGRDCVLRHYHRGGQAARVSRDRFLWAGERRTRSFAEWRLLDRIRQAGLPAPRPLAARYRRGGLLYRADLITLQLPGVVALSRRLAQGPVDADVWRNVGGCIARFHRAGFLHADLNAHNLQIDAGGAVFLLDFDRGRQVAGGGAWQQRGLQRLHRSLAKISRDGTVRFEAADWATLLSGYREAMAAAAAPG